MVLRDSPLTKGWNSYWTKQLYIHFPVLKQYPEVMCLSLKEYLIDIPQKAYDMRTYKEFYSFLISIKKESPTIIINYLKEYAYDLNLALNTLNEINRLDIHDYELPNCQIERIRFIENNIHYNYQLLTESVLHVFILLIAIDKRISRNKPVDGLDIYNCIEEIKATSFSYISDCYNNTVRNGIAHGDFCYTHLGISYRGKKGSAYIVNEREIIFLFDKMVDYCNALALGFKIFMIMNQDFFKANQLFLPQSFLIQELKAQINAPRWELLDCLESYTIDNQKQLNIFIKNSLFDVVSVNYFAFRTAVFGEYFAPEYDRYFISLQSKYSLPGWGAYNGAILRRGRKINSLEGYRNVLEDGVLFFMPKIKLPKFVIKIITLETIFRNNWQLNFHQNTNNIFKRKYLIRDAQIHSKKLFLVVNEARIYIYPDYSKSAKMIVEQEYKRIVKYAIRQSKKKISKLSLMRLLDVKVIRVYIYESDMRIRTYQNAGLIDKLVCTISVNKTKTIKDVDITGGTPEQFGIYRIVWNRKWLQKIE